jgi:hypothetical protein
MALGTMSGRLASVKLAANVIVGMGTWTIPITLDEIDATSFGSTWKKTDVGFSGWTATFSGYYDTGDTTGQGALQTAAIAGTLLTDIRFFVDSTSYWCPDTTSDSAAGCRITSLEMTFDKADIGRISYSVAGTGPLALV